MSRRVLTLFAFLSLMAVNQLAVASAESLLGYLFQRAFPTVIMITNIMTRLSSSGNSADELTDSAEHVPAGIYVGELMETTGLAAKQKRHRLSKLRSAQRHQVLWGDIHDGRGQGSNPCTIVDWKHLNEDTTPSGTIFTDDEFDIVKHEALELQPFPEIFDDESELSVALEGQGMASHAGLARQQISGLLLNLGVGILAEHEQRDFRCMLSEEVPVSNGSCDCAEVGECLEKIIEDYEDGDFEEAKTCAAELNNGNF